MGVANNNRPNLISSLASLILLIALSGCSDSTHEETVTGKAIEDGCYELSDEGMLLDACGVKYMKMTFDDLNACGVAAMSQKECGGLNVAVLGKIDCSNEMRRDFKLIEVGGSFLQSIKVWTLPNDRQFHYQQNLCLVDCPFEGSINGARCGPFFSTGVFLILGHTVHDENVYRGHYISMHNGYYVGFNHEGIFSADDASNFIAALRVVRRLRRLGETTD